MTQDFFLDTTHSDSSNPDLYLASQSPRRALLLEQLSVDFIVLAVDIDESQTTLEPPNDYVLRMATRKAQQGFRCLDESNTQATYATVLAADTAVVFNQKILGKPKNRADAKQMLSTLSGHSHEVLTGICLAQRQRDGRLRQESLVNKTSVTFRSITEQEIEWYWQTGEPKDKAGGYGIQGKAAMFISHISGSYSGVMGLPLFETSELMTRFGFALSGRRLNER
ncbi:MAG: hypothetical protein CL692_02060 [Cellvibrionales bacterium]|nr:hypothetical protein [Cellvibrionales bacterium]HCH20307.1 hypothetical protein [Cellvibrionales bacterium]